MQTKIDKYFPPTKTSKDALKLMLVDLSTYYIKVGDNREYNVVEPPLGLMALISYINNTSIGKQINFKIIKSFIDFNSHEELVDCIKEFSPDLLGFRTMTFYKNFFHDAIAHIRKMQIKTPIIVGGPYPTASYIDVMKDENIDLAVIAEGEITFSEILEKMLKNNNKFPLPNELATVNGVVFRKN